MRPRNRTHQAAMAGWVIRTNLLCLAGTGLPGYASTSPLETVGKTEPCGSGLCFFNRSKQMEISQKKQIKVNAKTIKICVKCSDRFSYEMLDEQGAVIYEQYDGYVPDFMPGEHYGDYIILDIDLDTGVVTNWTVPTVDQIEGAIKSQDD
jgi:hypothetical protein